MDEFGFLRNLKKNFNFDLIGDDCAVLPFSGSSDLVVTADLLVEEVDFKMAWADPFSIGYKSLAVSLSDIAAMGADPVWALLSIGIPDSKWKKDYLDEFYAGFSELAGRAEVQLAGGDISRSPDRFFVDSVVIGKCEKGRAVLRSGATAGDVIAVSGPLGGSAGGLRIVEEQGFDPHHIGESEKALVDRFLRPLPKLETGTRLSHSGAAKAMIDISDGLSSDLRHICTASGVGARVEAAKVPVDPALVDYLQGTGESPLRLALHGGEDFELLVTSGPENRSVIEGLGCVVIGEIVADPATFEIVTETGTEDLPALGFRHFG